VTRRSFDTKANHRRHRGGDIRRDPPLRSLTFVQQGAYGVDPAHDVTARGGLAGLDERLDRFGVSEHLDSLFEFPKEAS
jgi:hypothetical protein